MVNISLLTGKKLKAWWYNPRTGKASVFNDFKRKKENTFSPPDVPAEGNDWVLVLDDADKNFRNSGHLQ